MERISSALSTALNTSVTEWRVNLLLLYFHQSLFTTEVLQKGKIATSNDKSFKHKAHKDGTEDIMELTIIMNFTEKWAGGWDDFM